MTGTAQTPVAALERLEAALEIVRRQCPHVPVLAIRWMHLKHPMHRVQMLLLREHLGITGECVEPADHGAGARRLQRWIRPLLLRRMGQCVVYALVLSYRLLMLRLRLRRPMVSFLRRRFEVVIKTCCFGPVHHADGQDFYFGDLQHRLAQRGLQTLLLCGDVRDGNWTAFARSHLALTPAARLPELVLLHPLAPFRLMAKQFMSSFRLLGLAATMADPLVRHICRLASQDCLAPDTAGAGLSFWIGKAAVETWRPRAFVSLYEGHAWEVCARWGAKAGDATCQTVGYQHTAIFPESLALIRPSNPTALRVVPDVVLGLGRGSLALMRSGHERARARLVQFGSFRYREAAGLRRPADRNRRVILVTPEGIASEVTALFEFAYACASRMPAYTFVLRCHPEVPREEALTLVSVDLTTLPNIHWSDQGGVEEEFARSSAVLYRGSSVVLYAVLHGLLPLYAHIPMSLDRDPLYWLGAWRKRCATPQEVADVLAWYEHAPMEHLEGEWESAAQAVSAYTGAVGEDQIDACVEAMGLKQSGAAPCDV